MSKQEYVVDGDNDDDHEDSYAQTPWNEEWFFPSLTHHDVEHDNQGQNEQESKDTLTESIGYMPSLLLYIADERDHHAKVGQHADEGRHGRPYLDEEREHHIAHHRDAEASDETEETEPESLLPREEDGHMSLQLLGNLLKRQSFELGP